MANRSRFGFKFSHPSFYPTPYRWTLADEEAAKIAAQRGYGSRRTRYSSADPTTCVRGGVAPEPVLCQPPLENEEAEVTHIHRLPEEILLTVFGLLDLVDLARSVIPVCTRWHRLGQDESLWTRRTLRYDPLSESSEDFICTLLAAPSLGAVEYISDDRKTRQDIAEALARGCSQISTLRLLQWHQTPALLRKILEHLAKNIEHLEIYIPDLSLLVPISYMNSLKHLILHGEISYVTDLLLNLGTGCQGLISLDLGGLRFNDIFHLDSLMEAVVRGHANSLVSLKLPPNLNSACVLDAVALCTKLKVLAIWITPHITSASLTKSLSSLELESLTWRNYDGWLDSVELAQFILYSDAFSRLTEFRLIDCIDMDDGLARAIAYRSQNLLSLSLHRSELSAEGLSEILAHAKCLVNLDLYKNSCFTIEHLRLISSLLPNLRNLDVRRCYNIRSLSQDEWDRVLFDLSQIKIKFD